MHAARLNAIAFAAALIVTAPNLARGQELSSVLSSTLFTPSDLVGTQPDLVGTRRPIVFAASQDLPGVTKEEEHPTPPSVGFSAFARTIAADFGSFPQRPSTWGHSRRRRCIGLARTPSR